MGIEKWTDRYGKPLYLRLQSGGFAARTRTETEQSCPQQLNFDDAWWSFSEDAKRISDAS
ncbi:MAG: hypothetical protein IKN34_09430 [Treponema sp.]|nr:hypothetical protein [Treponema sp.]